MWARVDLHLTLSCTDYAAHFVFHELQSQKCISLVCFSQFIHTCPAETAGESEQCCHILVVTVSVDLQLLFFSLMVDLVAHVVIDGCQALSLLSHSSIQLSAVAGSIFSLRTNI